MGVTDALFRNVVWPLWARRDDPRYPRYAAEIARRQFDSEAIRNARQNAALRRIVRHAMRTVPYYQDRFATFCKEFDSNSTVDWISELPILTKNDIRTHADRLCSGAVPKHDTIEKKTSGSTGVPLRVRLDRGGLAWKRACTLVADEWSGWRRGELIAKVWGNPEYKQFGIKGWLRNRLFERAIHLDTLQTSAQQVEAFARRLTRFQPSLLFGHAHSLHLLAAHYHTAQIAAPQPNGIIATAMVLHDYQRKLIETVFNCPVTNRYGCEEVSLIACECPNHNGLHINTESVFVELLADERPAKPGEPGQVVVTDLCNYAMPLIRYRVGDVAVWSDAICTCGRTSPRLERIEGREADYVSTPDGQLISGISLTENFATLVPGIAQLQIIQESRTQLRFRIVRGADFDDQSESNIAALVQKRFGAGVRFQCDYVDAIPQERSGKYRFCISHVPLSPEKLAA